MASHCRRCFADILWCDLRGTDPPTAVPLDEHCQINAGENRYRITEPGARPKVERVPITSNVTAAVDHRSICGQPIGM